MKFLINNMKQRNIMVSTAVVFRRLSRIFVALLTSFVLFRIISLNAYAKYKVVYGLTESMPSLSHSEAVKRAFYYQTEPFLLGLANDVIVALILAILMHRMSRYIQNIFIVSLCVFLAVNIEHIFVNSAHVSFGLIPAGLDSTFISAEADQDFFKKAVVLILGAFLSSYFLKIKKVENAIVRSILPLSLISLIVTHSGAFPYPTWLSTNPLFNIRLSQTLTVDESYPPDETTSSVVTPALTEPSLNVITIYIEGLSRRSIAKAKMKNLQDLAGKNIEFTNYYSRQIITANGLYASQTGFTPAFTKRFSKWEAMKEGSPETRSALATLFASAGYHTAFLQSAPLNYMEKDEKMKLLGYKDVFGDSSWDKTSAASYNGWGIDDRTLYSNMLEYIDGLDKEKPWFLTALTTSTHSPYNVPGIENASRIDALRFADVALGEFVAALKQRRVLDNTLLVITSDEGREISDTPGMFNSLPQSQLPLVLVHPYLEPSSFSRPFLNTDLPNIISSSVVANDVHEIINKLPDHQNLVFGNYITQRIFWYDRSLKSIVACNFDFECQRLEGIDDISKFDVDTKKSTGISMPAFKEFILEGESDSSIESSL